MGLERREAGQVVVFAETMLDDRMTSTDTTDKPFKIWKNSKSYRKRIKRSNPTKVRPVWMGRRSSCSTPIWRTALYKIWNRMSSGQLLSTAGYVLSPFPKRVVVRGF